MPQSNSRRVIFRLVLFTLAGWALWALGRDDAEPGTAETEPAPERRPRTGFSKRRLATSLAFATLFFAGAAFSAGAGDLVVQAVEGTTDSVAETTTEATDTQTDTTAVDETPADPAPAPPAPSADDSTPPADPGSADGGSADGGGQPSDQPSDPADQPSDPGGAPPSGGEGGSQSGGDPSGQPVGSGSGNAGGGDTGGKPGQPAGPPEPAAGPGSESHAGDHKPQVSPPSAVDRLAAHDADVAAEAAGAFATIWLHRTVPDPTPAARRLDPAFANTLLAVSKSHEVDWALVLAVVRAQGHHGRVPATRHELVSVAARLDRAHANKDAWQALLAISSRTAFADRALALYRYNRAVGLEALVRGLLASKKALQSRVLNDSRIDIYPGGRSDIASGKVDVRVLALIRYLAEADGQVTVSCLISGHRLYARPGVVSAHIYGEAVDISGLEGKSIYGNQEPGGLTEQAVREILLLPVELQPKQVISLLGLGGPSFALANHYDHIHVGY